MTKTVIGLYDDLADAQRAIQELLTNGFIGDEINVVANKATGDTTAASTQGAIIGSLAELTSVTIPGIGPTVAAGPLFSSRAAEKDGTRTNLLDVFLNAGVPWERSHYYAEGIRRGGALVIVRPPDHMAVRAVQIIHHYGPVDVDQRARQWRENGWRGFDAEASSYSKADIERERQVTEARA